MPRLLTCPDCNARYRVPDGAIGADGTTVRCTACDSTWFAASEATTPDALELSDLEAAEEGDMAMVAAPAPIGAVDMGAVDMGVVDMGAADMKPDNKPDSEPIDGAALTTRMPNAATAIRRKRHADARRGRVKAIVSVWLVALATIMAALVAALLLRQTLVERFPAAARVYDGLGLTTTASGLALGPVEMRITEVDGTDYLVVSGHVSNLAGRKRGVPPIALTLIGPGGAELVSWSVDTGQAPLEEGGRRAYRSEYPNPSVDAQSLRIRFEGEAGGIDAPL